MRVCQQFQDKGQCINNVPHHNDQAKCQAEPQEQPPQGQQPGGPQHCSNDGQCGGGICNSDNNCVQPNSQPEGASCQASDGSFRSALCHQGLACKVTVGNGAAQGLCAQPTPWP